VDNGAIPSFSAELTMHQIERIITAAEDPNLTSPAKAVMSLLTRHTDAHGIVGADHAGHPLAAPAVIAANLSLGESTTHKAIVALEEAGYLVWERSPMSQRNRNRGLAGKIQIIYPASAS
jgi:DNA-binding MarR family transcriptional regulator